MALSPFNLTVRLELYKVGIIRQGLCNSLLNHQQLHGVFSGIAMVCLEEGNKEFTRGEAKNAINSYTEGLQVNCKDKRLNAKLYSNRATAHFRLGNNFISKYINISCSVTR